MEPRIHFRAWYRRKYRNFAGMDISLELWGLIQLGEIRRFPVSDYTDYEPTT